MISEQRWSIVLVLLLVWSCRERPKATDTSHGGVTGAETRILTPGELAPDFSALSQTGYEVALGQLSSKPVAVYFCPGGINPSCAALMLAFRDRWLTLNQRLGMLLFVVPSDYNDNRAHSVRHELPFLVLADTTGSISRSYGLGVESSGATPTGVLVGTDRKIRRVLSEPSSAEHVSALASELP